MDGDLRGERRVRPGDQDPPGRVKLRPERGGETHPRAVRTTKRTNLPREGREHCAAVGQVSRVQVSKPVDPSGVA